MSAQHPFLLQLFLIFVFAKLGGEIFERLRLPAVLGEILAGILIGPYGARLVVLDDPIKDVAEVGAIFLLFTVGLEIQPKDLLGVGRTSLYVALAGITVPFLSGFAYMLSTHHSTPEATFVGAAMIATSVGITARILGDLNLLNTRAARIILAAAVFDDILGLIILGVVGGLVSTSGSFWVQTLISSIEAGVFALVMIFYAPRIVRRIEPGVQRMSTPDAPLVIALAICLGLSYAAAQIKMAAIVGAFFAGLAFAEYSPRWNLRPRISGINDFLAPFFFFTMGAQVNIKVFDRELVLAAIAIFILAFVSKLVGCGLPVLRFGWKTAAQVGTGMVPRGEVGLIVALNGLQLNAISERTYAIVIFMTGMTTMVAPPLLKMLFQSEGNEATVPTEGRSTAM